MFGIGVFLCRYLFFGFLILASGCSHCRMGVSLDPWRVPDIVRLGLSIGWRCVCVRLRCFLYGTQRGIHSERVCLAM